jgi:hypothetical protein
LSWNAAAPLGVKPGFCLISMKAETDPDYIQLFDLKQKLPSAWFRRKKFTAEYVKKACRLVLMI